MSGSEDHKRPSSPGPNSGSPNKKPKFDFWASRKQDAASISDTRPVKTTIGTLTKGEFENSELQFRICSHPQLIRSQKCVVLKFIGMDTTGEIGFVAFNETATRLQNLKFNDVYTVNKFRVKNRNMKFPNGTDSTYELELISGATVKDVDDIDFSPIPLNLRTLNNLDTVQTSDLIDVLGILCHEEPLVLEYDTARKVVYLTDETTTTVKVVIYGPRAHSFAVSMYQPVLFRNVKMYRKDADDFKLGTVAGTLIWENPAIPNKDELVRWFEQEMKNA